MMIEIQYISKHKLDFEVAEWIMRPYMRFRIGTCTGLWNATNDTYDILAIDNSDKGNGHFEDVLQWFENSCKRDGKNFRFLEVWNKNLKKHLIAKRGFKDIGEYNLLKIIDQMNEND